MITDETLYRRYVGGDDKGLNGLMGRYGDSLTFYINGYLHDLHESEDLMVEAFSYLIAKKPKMRDEGFRSYLYKTARHLALRHKARNRLRQAFNFDDLEADAESQGFSEEVIQTKERNRILHLCMEQLSPDYREALYLVYFENMSHTEAGVVMGKSQKQVSNLAAATKRRYDRRWKRRVYTVRSNEKRVAAVKRRSKELKRESGKRRERIVLLSSIAACLVLIVALSLAMPGIVENFSNDALGYSAMTASVFHGSGAFGYIVIGLLAFALGVCVTVLCYLARRSEHEEKAEETQRANDDD